MLFPVLLALDLLSALFLVGLAAFFFKTYRIARNPLHALFGLAFITLAIGVTTVSTSTFDETLAPGFVDGLRMATHTAAPALLVAGYVNARQDGHIRLGKSLTLALAATAAILTAVYLIPPTGFAIKSLRGGFLATHAFQFLLYLSLVGLSGSNFLRRPMLRRAFVPAGFLAYAFSKYTWLLIDFTGDERLVPLVYLFRFLMLGLFALALLLPFFDKGLKDAEA